MSPHKKKLRELSLDDLHSLYKKYALENHKIIYAASHNIGNLGTLLAAVGYNQKKIDPILKELERRVKKLNKVKCNK